MTPSLKESVLKKLNDKTITGKYMKDYLQLGYVQNFIKKIRLIDKISIVRVLSEVEDDLVKALEREIKKYPNVGEIFDNGVKDGLQTAIKLIKGDVV